MMDRINAIVLVVPDVEKCAQFYRDKLGFHLAQLERDEAYLNPGPGGGVVLALKSFDRLKPIDKFRIWSIQENSSK